MAKILELTTSLPELGQEYFNFIVKQRGVVKIMGSALENRK
jgi:hypothetical protein